MSKASGCMENSSSTHLPTLSTSLWAREYRIWLSMKQEGWQNGFVVKRALLHKPGVTATPICAAHANTKWTCTRNYPRTSTQHGMCAQTQHCRHKYNKKKNTQLYGTTNWVLGCHSVQNNNGLMQAPLSLVVLHHYPSGLSQSTIGHYCFLKTLLSAVSSSYLQ